MSSGSNTQPASVDDGRRETELERIDRNLTELLGELRVLTTGVQVLFAFLLTVPFSQRFKQLGDGERDLYFFVLLSAASAAGLLIAPTALHRLLFRHNDKPHLIATANRLAICGICSLTVAMTGILALISALLFGWAAGVAAAVFAAGFFGGLWFGLGLRRRRTLARRSPPDFVADSQLLSDAYWFAQDAHEGPRSQDDTGIDHPVAVARLIARAGCPEPVIAAALLHDVVEDSATSVREIESRFGPQVARLVDALTENPEIGQYARRKAELRDRVRDAGRAAAAVFLADKLANAADVTDKDESSSERRDHYRQTLQQLTQDHPDLPFAAAARELASRLADK